jgi:hypothetical protein
VVAGTVNFLAVRIFRMPYCACRFPFIAVRDTRYAIRDTEKSNGQEIRCTWKVGFDLVTVHSVNKWMGMTYFSSINSKSKQHTLTGNWISWVGVVISFHIFSPFGRAVRTAVHNYDVNTAYRCLCHIISNRFHYSAYHTNAHTGVWRLPQHSWEQDSQLSSSMVATRPIHSWEYACVGRRLDAFGITTINY